MLLLVTFDYDGKRRLYEDPSPEQKKALLSQAQASVEIEVEAPSDEGGKFAFVDFSRDGFTSPAKNEPAKQDGDE